MIKNEKQYKISKSRLLKMNALVNNKKHAVKKNSVEEGALHSLISVRNKIRDEVRQYEHIKNAKGSIKKQVSLIQLPQILIEHKIAKGLTQKEFSRILGIKEQQLQRYEAEDYKSVSFGRLLEYIQKARIKIKLAVESA